MPLLDGPALVARTFRLHEVSLTFHEALAICDVVGMTYLCADPTPDLDDVAAGLHATFVEVGNPLLDEKAEPWFDLDVGALLAKLEQWTPEQTRAVVEAAAQYGMLPAVTTEGQRLAVVGLYRDEEEEYEDDVVVNGTHVLAGALQQLVTEYPTDPDTAPRSRVSLTDPAGNAAADVTLQPGHLPWLTRLISDELASCRNAHSDGTGRCGHCRGTGLAGGHGTAAPLDEPPADDGSRQ
jgi:hypothetical protein